MAFRDFQDLICCSRFIASQRFGGPLCANSLLGHSRASGFHFTDAVGLEAAVQVVGVADVVAARLQAAKYVSPEHVF